MKKILTICAVLAAFLFVFAGGCNKDTANTNQATNTENQDTESGNVTDRTDYVVHYTESSPPVPGGAIVHQYIIGQPTVEAEVIKQNAYFVPWKIRFSQVQRVTLTALPLCDNVTEQVVEIEGSLELDLSEFKEMANNLPDSGPISLSGTIQETVTGTGGAWACESGAVTSAANQGSADYVQSISGTHTANFSGASNMVTMTVDGAEFYLDFPTDNIQFIWPAGTKIERTAEDTPIPVEPIAPSEL